MQLLYLWVNNYRNFKNQGFKFHPAYEFVCKPDSTKLELTITPCPQDKLPANFWGENISSVTAVVGENGVGKSSLLKYQHLNMVGRAGKNERWQAFYVEINDKCYKFYFEFGWEHPEDPKINYVAVWKEELESIPSEEQKIVLEAGTKESLSFELKKNEDEPKFFVVNIDGDKKLLDCLDNNLDLKEKGIYYSNILSWTTTSPKRTPQESSKDGYDLSTTHLLRNGNIYHKYRIEEVRKLFKFFKAYFKLRGSTNKFPLQFLEKTSFRVSLKPMFYGIAYNHNYGRSKVPDFVKEIDKFVDKSLKTPFKELYFWVGHFYCENSDEQDEFWGAFNKQVKEKAVVGQTHDLEKKVIAFFEKKIGPEIYHYIQLYNQYYKDFSKRGISPKGGNLILEGTTIIRSEYHLGLNDNTVDLLTGFINWKSDDSLINFFLQEELISLHIDGLSSGEEAMLLLFSRLYNRLKGKKGAYLLLLDEADLGFHPDWQTKYLGFLLESLGVLFPDITFQLILATHSPFILSDIPTSNCIFLKKDEEGYSKVDKGLAISNTFGANIHELLADAFFMEGGLIGDFAKGKVNELLKRLSPIVRYKQLRSKAILAGVVGTIEQLLEEREDLEACIKWLDSSAKRTKKIEAIIKKHNLTELDSNFSNWRKVLTTEEKITIKNYIPAHYGFKVKQEEDRKFIEMIGDRFVRQKLRELFAEAKSCIPKPLKADEKECKKVTGVIEEIALLEQQKKYLESKLENKSC